MADPFILVLCSSAIRCMDVIRSLRTLHISAKIGKLFAKHMKIDEQVEFLKKNPVHIAVGTPNRVLKLMEKEAFSTNSLKLVLLDSTFKDSKQRTIFTLPECKQDLFNLYRHYLIRLLSNMTNDDDSLIKDKESESGINEQEKNQSIMVGLY
ncbi:U3-containing 90S pre-ribosomal complex subunit-domain containing protein [Paraphysoderma sedebokerense]|nr:U3-containing 90S pre-ribosomal complex subunit-domain containing protein [Paraphysoderma sedebokerense]KAI9140885.1 U3-containing 90S pre-ribosomal complex subunit-domain containing protein [Paraphysoderma sedebokerense]